MVIQSVTIITEQGVSIYRVGDTLNDLVISRIVSEFKYLEGDPIDFIRGYTEDGFIIFEINGHCPMAIHYKKQT